MSPPLRATAIDLFGARAWAPSRRSCRGKVHTLVASPSSRRIRTLGARRSGVRLGLRRLHRAHALRGLTTTAEIRRALVLVAKQASRRVESGRRNGSGLISRATTRPGVPGWDAERVVRHLERGVALGYQLLQRARWLCLLYDSAVVFQEPPSEHPRLLLLQGGTIVEARDLLPNERSPLLSRRVLCANDSPPSTGPSTIVSEHADHRAQARVARRGTAEVRVGRRRWLRGSTLEALLLWV